MSRLVIPAEKFYVTSDWHLCHANVIKFDDRPFKNVDQMDQAIINNFSHLDENDHLFFLGDLSFSKDVKKVIQLIAPLRCKLYWVKGNHDHHLFDDTELAKRFVWRGDLKEIFVQDGAERQLIVMCHYAMRVWNRSHRGAYHIYGHSHQSLPEDPKSLSFDAGCNGWDYEPINYDQVKKKMKSKVFTPIDHHR